MPGNQAHPKGSPINRWKKFARAFVKNGGNGTQACISAGYSKTTAGVYAKRLLKKAPVQKLIRECEQSMAKASALPDADYIIRSIDKIVRSTKTLPRDKIKGLELLAKWKSLLTQRIQIEAPKRIVIEDDQGKPITDLGANE